MSDDNPHVIDEQYKAMEEMQSYRAKAGLQDVMTGIAELAGGLQVLTLLSMAGYQEEAIKLLYNKAHGLMKTATDVYLSEQTMRQLASLSNTINTIQKG